MSLKYWAGTVVLCIIKIPLNVNIWQMFAWDISYFKHFLHMLVNVKEKCEVTR